MLYLAITGVRENLWPRQWVYSAAVKGETFQQLCSLFNLMGRDYTDAIVDSTLACSRLFANWTDVEKARDIEKAFSHFAVAPVTGHKPGLSEERRQMRPEVFSPKWKQKREEMLEEQRSIKHATTLFANRVFFITTVADEVGPQIPEERRLWQVQRLLRFPKCMLGLSTWEKLVKLEHQCNEAY